MTSESTELVTVDHVQLGTIQASGPDDVVQRATAIAKSLANVINDRKLFTVIKDRKYVRVEGWCTLGAMLGVLPRELDTHEIDNGYEALVELVRVSDGMVIGRGSAICTRDERNWQDRDPYAVRSMAITRATGKAYRLGFAWIVQLAGYEGTPAEEMYGVEESEPDTKAANVKSTEKSKTQATQVNSDSRPYSPKQLHDRINQSSAAFARDIAGKTIDPPSKGDFGAVMGNLEACFAGDPHSEDKRHSVLAYLFSVETGNDLMDGEILALKKWLNATTDSGGAWSPDPIAVREAQAVLRERMAELGQEELPVE